MTVSRKEFAEDLKQFNAFHAVPIGEVVEKFLKEDKEAEMNFFLRIHDAQFDRWVEDAYKKFLNLNLDAVKNCLKKREITLLGYYYYRQEAKIRTEEKGSESKGDSKSSGKSSNEIVLSYLRFAAEAGDYVAMYMLGVHLSDSAFMQKAIECEFPPAMVFNCRYQWWQESALRQKDKEQLQRALKKFSGAHYIMAKLILDSKHLYRGDKDGSRRRADATKHYRIAIRCGHLDALYDLGVNCDPRDEYYREPNFLLLRAAFFYGYRRAVEFFPDKNDSFFVSTHFLDRYYHSLFVLSDSGDCFKSHYNLARERFNKILREYYKECFELMKEVGDDFSSVEPHLIINNEEEIHLMLIYLTGLNLFCRNIIPAPLIKLIFEYADNRGLFFQKMPSDCKTFKEIIDAENFSKDSIARLPQSLFNKAKPLIEAAEAGQITFQKALKSVFR